MASRVAKAPTLLKGRRMRVTRIDACGRPVYGDDAVVVTKGFISVAYTANTNEPDDITVVNADGETIADERGIPTISGYGIEVTMGQVDPELFSLMTGMPIVLDADGNPVGISIDTKVSLAGQGYALEVWTGTAGSGDACADEAAEGQYGYFLVPFAVGGILGDFTIENGALNMTLTGANTKDGNAWGRGPYDVQLNRSGQNKVAGPLVNPITATMPLTLMLTEVAPPSPAIGSRPLLDPSAPVLASITPTITGRSVVFAVAPDVPNGTGVWYDFGDNSWDYIEDGTDPTHVYAAAGTYTVRASANGTWISRVVTIAA